MSPAPSLGIPELAGLATYGEAARIGYGVDENVVRLLRFHWVELRLHQTAILRLTATPEWEVKGALALHQWLDIEHADALRRRLGEMRHPALSLTAAPDTSLDAFLDEVLRADDTLELLAGVYGVARRALVAAYRRHLARTNPLADHPTRRLLRSALLDEEEALAWGEAALEGLLARDPAARPRVAAWASHLRAYLGAAGGIAGDETRDADAPGGGAVGQAPLPPPRAARPFVPDFTPRRDERFDGQYNFNFPPHAVCNAEGVPAAERNLALLCKRTLEMDVPEMMASILGERREAPWEFQREFSRQLWDEARHAMMGTVAFEDRGVDWTRIPLNVSFALRLNRHATPLERQLVLFAIEQNLMSGDTGKRSEYRTAVAAGDALSAHFHDYDWADEVLHAQIGRRWAAHEQIGVEEATRRAQEVHERTWAALDRYRGREPQADWWADFVRDVTGSESRARLDPGAPVQILAE